MYLFLNECTIPKRARFDAALKRRILRTHRKISEIEESYNNWMAGYRGEKSVDYYLGKLPGEEYLIIHNVRLQIRDKFFQIDKLLLKFTHGLNLEVKNWAGQIHFDQNLGQVIRTVPEKGIKERVQNPILQAKEQSLQLRAWLAKQGIYNYPIEHFFVNSNSKTIISVDPGYEQILKRACNSEILLEKIIETNKTHRKTIMDQNALQKLGQAIIAAYVPPQYDIQKEYQINPTEVIPGVHCPVCFSIPMTYKYGTWHCSNCNHHSKMAHIDTVYDYFLLIKPMITNAELRRFLHIPSIYIANEILKSIGLPFIGNNKGRIYLPPHNF